MSEKKHIRVVIMGCRTHCNGCGRDMEHIAFSLEEIVNKGFWYKDGKCPACDSNDIEGENIEKEIEVETGEK